MKKEKIIRNRIISLLTSVILIFSFITLIHVNHDVNAATSLNASQITNYFESMVGKSWGEGLCLNFVRTCFQNLGVPYSSANCAYEYGSTFIDSTSRDDIPVGADVFFTGPVSLCGICSACGNSAGHVGVYVGNGYIIHAYSGKVQKHKIDTIISHGYTYRGWGFHANITVINDSASIKPFINITNYSLPTGKLEQGKAFGVSGMISSYPNINRVWGGVYTRDGSKTDQWCDVNPNSTSYNLATYFDSHIIFNILPVGYYTYKIEATTTDGQHKEIHSDFQIGDPPQLKWYNGLNPANLGERIDAIILNKNCWKPIRPDSSANVVLHTEEWTTGEMWRFNRQSDGSYKIENFGNGLCLDANGRGTTNGTNVGVYENNDTTAQRWFVYEVNGGYAFRPVYCDLAMDLNGNNTDDNNNIHLWEYHGKEAQIFSIYTNGSLEYAKPFPKAPVLTAKNYSSIILSWDKTMYTDKYLIYRSTDNSTWAKIGEVTSPGYTDSNLSANTKYYYRWFDRQKSEMACKTSRVMV